MISVIIPVYNVEEYLHDCLFSVLNQSFQDFEIICVEDCSIDSSLEILESFSKLDDRIKIVRNEVNSSLGFSRNRGLEHANGKYVLFLDSDDWIDFNCLEILFHTAERSNLEVLMFKAINYDDEENIFYHDNYYDMNFMAEYINKIFNYKDLEFKDVLKVTVSAWNKLYLKSFITDNNLKFPVKLIHEDNPFFYEMFYKAKRVSLIDNFFYNRRRRIGSITTRTGEEVIDVIKIIELCVHIALEDNEIYQQNKSLILNRMFHSLTIKYDFIDDEYKERFYVEIKELIFRLCSDYPDLAILNDMHKCLNKKNRDFFNFLELD